MLLQFSRFLTVFSAVCVAGVLVGCGSDDKWADERPTPVPVTGTVLYKGEPIPDATVLFVPSGHKNAATGRTDANGQFQLQTFEPGDGAVPGEFKVSIRKVEVSTAQAAGGQDDAEAPPPEERSLLPVKYADANSSGLTASVQEGAENDFPFDLADGPLTGGSSSSAAATSRGE